MGDIQRRIHSWCVTIATFLLLSGQDKVSVAFRSPFQGFDQEAACVSLARMCVEKADKEDSLEILKWVDRCLIRVV